MKLAIFLILSLAAALAAGTILESVTDTPTAQFWVYRSLAFHGILGLLGANIFCVAISRLPWKPRHIPFLMAHVGILLLLSGAWVTENYGLDGNLRIGEGETGSVVEMTNTALSLSEGQNVRRVPVPWTPPNATFKPIHVDKYELVVDQFLPHADPNVSFVPMDEEAPGPVLPALRLRVEGGPMRIKQDFWLWAGDPAWSQIQAGPATLSLVGPGMAGAAHGARQTTLEHGPAGEKTPDAAGGAPKRGPTFTVTARENGDVTYVAESSTGARRTGKFAGKQAAGQVIDPGWKGNVKLTLVEWIPRAMNYTTYQPSKMLYGDAAPPSAVHIVAGEGGKGAETWLGLGDRASLQFAGREISLGYLPERVVLPFSIRLERFTVDHNVGTRDPAAYSSKVTVVDRPGPPGSGASPAGEIDISMNEPLHYRGITFYQASFEEAEPRPTVTILSVNRDPGRWMKYIGSILIVAGAILLFAVKYVKKNLAAKANPVKAATATTEAIS